jgi:hypothetical protein
MATVRVNVPEPVEKTYDILGLTEKEMTFLVSLVGEVPFGTEIGAFYNQLPTKLYTKMFEPVRFCK